MKYIPILFIVAIVFSCEQRSNESAELQSNPVDTLRYGNYFGTNFYDDISTLELQNSDSSHLFKLIQDSIYFVRIELDELDHLELQLVSKNPNIAVTKLSATTFELTVIKQIEEPDNNEAQLALLNTFESSRYVIIRRDTTENSETFIETQPFVRLDTIVYYTLKIK